MLNITKLYDVEGWCYYFLAKEMAKYSKCRFTPQRWDKVDYHLQDIVLISDPTIKYPTTAITIPKMCKEKGIKVIGQYCGENDLKYDYADLIVTITPQLYLWAKEKYKGTDIPVIFLPESIDTDYFEPSEHLRKYFTPGWAGGAHKPIKRTHLLSQLKYPVKIQSDYGKDFFREGRSQTLMKEFYKSIDCFVTVSETETLSRVTLEAMASGLPVIATDVGGAHLLLPDAWIVPVYPESLVITEVNKRLEELENSFELRDGIGRVNRAWAETVWSWKNNMPIWDEVFYYLKEGNISKIEEISDSCIGSFAKYFEPCEKYTQQIKRFTKIDTSKFCVPYAQELFASVTKELMEKLQKYTGNYWLANHTCLDAINHQQLLLHPGQFYLGVPSENEKALLIKYLQSLDAVVYNDKLFFKDLSIHILIEEIKGIKSASLYGYSTKVPCPVVAYLEDRFGYEWKKK